MSSAPSDKGSGLSFVIVLVSLLLILERWYIYNGGTVGGGVFYAVRAEGIQVDLGTVWQSVCSESMRLA
jgi:hypothetical protein